MECQNLTLSRRYSMDLSKSISFYGINGKTEIQCTKVYTLFKIGSSSSEVTRIKFNNLVISKSNIVARIDAGTNMDLTFHRTLIRNSIHAIYGKNSTYCSLLITNSSLQHSQIRLQCSNVNVHFVSSSFIRGPVLFTNLGNKPPRSQGMFVSVRNTFVDGKHSQMCDLDLFAIKPLAAAINVTISDSVFKNHLAKCRFSHEISTVHIYGHNTNVENYSYIFLSKLLVENTYTTWAALAFRVGYQQSTKVKAMIRDCTFRNNSGALRVSSRAHKRTSRKTPTILLENNTFVDHRNEQIEPNVAAAIYFDRGKSRVTSCCFFDNMAGENPYTGVVTISKDTTVTFFNSYFENRQTDAGSNQLFVKGNRMTNFIGNNTFNLLALKKRQSVLIRIPNTVRTGLVLRKNFKIICPQGYKINPAKECKDIKDAILCYYVNFECQRCPTKTYTIERGELIFNTSNDIKCRECPRGGDCDVGLIKAKDNFWGYAKFLEVKFVQCPPGYCCELEDCITYNSCFGNRTGTLCGRCPEGMSESLLSTECMANEQCPLNYFFLLGVVAFLALYLVFFIYHKETLSFLRASLFSQRLYHITTGSLEYDSSSPSGMIKIFFYYYQVCNLLQHTTRSKNHEGFFENLERIISGTMNMVLVYLPPFKCPFKNLRPVPKRFVLHSTGYCLLVLLFLLYLTNKLFLILRNIKAGNDGNALRDFTARYHNDDNTTLKPSFAQRIASAFTYVFLLMYASSAQFCLSLLNCIPAGEHQVLMMLKF